MINMQRILITGAVLGVVLAAVVPLRTAIAQGVPQAAQSSTALTLHNAIERAHRNQPDLRAAREAVAAAAALERQAAAWQNPTFSWSREHVSRTAGTNAEDILRLEQPVPVGGQRSARREAARLRREVAEARLRAAEVQLGFEVKRAYAVAVAADRRAALATEAAAAFTTARRASEQRLAAGDIAGYVHRRLGLESARYATLRGAAVLDQRAARLSLAALVTATPDSIGSFAAQLVLTDTLPASTPGHVGIAVLAGNARSAALDSLLVIAFANRPELQAVLLEADAAVAEARLTSRSRVPVPAISAGVKREQIPGVAEHGSGLVAGVSLPLPLWDRGGGSVGAAEAEARRRTAIAEGVRRQTVREVTEAYEAVLATLEQTSLLQTDVGADDPRLALRAAQAAYAEGEISLVEWLDAVRAYHETLATWATLRAEAAIRFAELERAIGRPLSPAGTGTTGGIER